MVRESDISVSTASSWFRHSTETIVTLENNNIVGVMTRCSVDMATAAENEPEGRWCPC